jgi:hypothetical protein
MEVLGTEEIEFRDQKKYKLFIENDPFFYWKKIKMREQEIYYLQPISFGYFFHILAHDHGIKIPELETKREVADYDEFYVTYKLRNNVYVKVIIETEEIYTKQIEVTIWLFFFW